MIAGVVLASGFSRRMGHSKLTLDLGGRTFLQRVIDAATNATKIDMCFVVVRPEDQALVDQLGLPGVQPLINPFAAEGQSASVRLGATRLLEEAAIEAGIFAVVDQPFLKPEVFDALAEGWQAGLGEILVSSYAGQRGNPVLFGRQMLPELCCLEGDVGGREVLRAHPEVVAEVPMPDTEAGRDVDTWEEYLALQGIYGGQIDA